MAIDSKLNDFNGKSLVQRMKNKGIAYITPLILLTGCSDYEQGYSNGNYEINLNPGLNKGELIINENSKFLGIHWFGREQRFYFEVNQDSIDRIENIQPKNIELKEYHDDKGILPFNERKFFSQDEIYSPKKSGIQDERMRAKQNYLRNEWPKLKEIMLKQLRKY